MSIHPYHRDLEEERRFEDFYLRWLRNTSDFPAIKFQEPDWESEYDLPSRIINQIKRRVQLDYKRPV